MEKKTFAIMQEISGMEIRNLRKKLSLSQSAFGRLTKCIHTNNSQMEAAWKKYPDQS